MHNVSVLDTARTVLSLSHIHQQSVNADAPQRQHFMNPTRNPSTMQSTSAQILDLAPGRVIVWWHRGSSAWSAG